MAAELAYFHTVSKRRERGKKDANGSSAPGGSASRRQHPSTQWNNKDDIYMEQCYSCCCCCRLSGIPVEYQLQQIGYMFNYHAKKDC